MYTKRFFQILAVYFLYIIIRYVIYRFFPVTNFDSWIIRDTMVDIPRVLGILAIVSIIGLKGLMSELSSVRSITVLQAIIIILFIVSGFEKCFHYSFLRLSNYDYFILFVNTVLVGLFEELLFRKAFHDEVFKLKNMVVSCFITSALFTIFHIQAQNFSEFPAIFSVGILFAILREKGVPLIWLVLSHISYDLIVLFWADGGLTDNDSNQILVIGFYLFLTFVILGEDKLVRRNSN